MLDESEAEVEKKKSRSHSERMRNIMKLAGMTESDYNTLRDDIRKKNAQGQKDRSSKTYSSHDSSGTEVVDVDAGAETHAQPLDPTDIIHNYPDFNDGLSSADEEEEDADNLHPMEDGMRRRLRPNPAHKKRQELYFGWVTGGNQHKKLGDYFHSQLADSIEVKELDRDIRNARKKSIRGGSFWTVKDTARIGFRLYELMQRSDYLYQIQCGVPDSPARRKSLKRGAKKEDPHLVAFRKYIK